MGTNKFCKVLNYTICLEEISRITIMYCNGTNYSNKWVHTLLITYKNGGTSRIETTDREDAHRDYGNLETELLSLKDGEKEALQAENATLRTELEQVKADNNARKSIPLTPIYTCGGHGYSDDDDEDFWCPVCHTRLGTHTGFLTKCPECEQIISENIEPHYDYHDLIRERAEWRGKDGE